MDDFLGAQGSDSSAPVAAEEGREDKGNETGRGVVPVSYPPVTTIPADAVTISGDTWSLPIEHLSASSLNMLAICPRQFQQRYILHKKEPPSQAQVVGSSFHTAIEHNYRQKQVSYEDLPIDDVIDFYHDEAWPQAVDDAGGEDSVKWWAQKDAKLTGALMVTSYRREICPTIQPQEVEYQFSVKVQDTPVPVVGRIDVIDAETIIDLKTSKRKVSKMKPGWRNQGRVYQLVTPRNAAFHVVTNKGENVTGDFEIRYSYLAWLETEKWVAQLAETANHLYRTYGADTDWPTTGTAHDWRCDWCGYRKDCPAWRS